jgi:hypothetical protein
LNGKHPHRIKEIIRSLELINGVDAVFLFRALSFNTSTNEIKKKADFKKVEI